MELLEINEQEKKHHVKVKRRRQTTTTVKKSLICLFIAILAASITLPLKSNSYDDSSHFPLQKMKDLDIFYIPI